MPQNLNTGYYIVVHKAYDSVLLELVTGPMFTQEERQAILEHMSMYVLRKLVISTNLDRGHCLFEDTPLPADLTGSHQRMAKACVVHC